jgi:hypothetical protein
MNKAQELLAVIPVDEAKIDQGAAYKVLRQMEKPSWNSFMTDIQQAMGAEGEKLIPTVTLDKIMKRAIKG